jgi:hypothetical protein
VDFSLSQTGYSDSYHFDMHNLIDIDHRDINALLQSGIVAKTCDAVGKGRVSELNIPKLFLINF